jgi:hypothetical protein
MASAITDLLDRVTDSTTGRPVISTLAAPGKAIAAASINISDATNWTTTTAIHFSIYKTKTVAGVTVKDTTQQTDWKGTLSGTTISNLTLTGGTDQAYTAGDIVELTPTARYAKDLYEWGAAHANQDGSLKASAIQSALNLGSSSLNGWNPLGYTPNTVTYNGNRSYSLVFNSVDISGTLSAGTRLRTTRNTAAPNQCTSLNGTTQYYSKSSPSGMTFTDDFTVSAWVKLTSYGSTQQAIASRYNGTSGWRFDISSTGQVELVGFNAGAANFSLVTSYASIPLNKWVHVSAQLDMSSFTYSSTTSYVMIDGVEVSGTVSRGGTNPTALVQAGNLEIGSSNGGTTFFPGKIAQVAIYSAKVTEATVRGTASQTLAGTETSLISAYSFNNTINDLNTTNANNLTANGSAVATNADSPFGLQASGSISTTLDYAIVQQVTFSTNTTVVVQVSEGCTIPTSGTVSSVSYAGSGQPYGMPAQRNKWVLETIYRIDIMGTETVAGTWVALTANLTLPIGVWRYGMRGTFAQQTTGAAGTRSGWLTLASGTPTNSNTIDGGNDYPIVRILGISAASTHVYTDTNRDVELSAQTTYTPYVASDAITATETAGFRATQGAVRIYAENLYL